MSEEGEKVVLNIYDLSQGLAQQLSTSLLGKAIEGIWHTGVVVYGTEYFFGGGIQRTLAGRTPYGSPYRVVNLGFTQVPKEVFEEYLNEISPRFTQETYNVLRHNCNNFSEEVTQFLLGSGIPEYILRLPDEIMSSPMGSMLLPMIQQLETNLKHNQVPDIPQQLHNTGVHNTGVPDFSAIHIPTSGRVPSRQRSTSPPSSTTAGQDKISSATGSPASNREVVMDTSAADQDLKSETDTPKKKISANHPEKKDTLGQARAKVQEEITREFMELMTSGSLRASEAAALAARRVMARHGIASN